MEKWKSKEGKCEIKGLNVKNECREKIILGGGAKKYGVRIKKWTSDFIFYLTTFFLTKGNKPQPFSRLRTRNKITYRYTVL
jgi:hypothetical protein